MLQLGNNHLTVGIELIDTGNHGSAVGEDLTVDEGAAQIRAGVDEELVALIDEVEVTLKLHQLVLSLANAVHVEVTLNRTVQDRSDAILGAAVVNAGIPDIGAGGRTGKEVMDTGHHKAAAVEQVGLTADLVCSAGVGVGRHISVEAGAVPVAGTGGGNVPGTLGHATLIKDELNAVVSALNAIQTGVGSGVEVVPIVIHTDPTREQLTGDRVVGLAINDVEAGACVLVTALANQASVLNVNSVGMTGGGNRGAPVNDGVTTLAEGSAGVTVLCTGGSLCLLPLSE